jgi:hypothetical protein
VVVAVGADAVSGIGAGAQVSGKQLAARHFLGRLDPFTGGLALNSQPIRTFRPEIRER